MKKKAIITVAAVTVAAVSLGFFGGGSTCDPTGEKNLEIPLADKIESNTIKKELIVTSLHCGTFQAEALDIPDGAKRIVIALERQNWKDEGEGVDVIKVETDYFDGKEWHIDPNGGIGGFTTDGGDRPDEKGQVALESFSDATLPKGTGRKIRVRVLAKTDLSSSVKVYFK